MSMTQEEKAEVAKMMLEMLKRSDEYKNLSKQQIERLEKKQAREKAREDRKSKRREEAAKDKAAREKAEKDKWAFHRKVEDIKPGFVEAKIPEPAPVVFEQQPAVEHDPHPPGFVKTFTHKPAVFEHAAGTEQVIADLANATINSKPQTVTLYRLKAGTNITISETAGVITIEADGYTPPTYDEIELTYCASGTPTTRTFLAIPL